MNGYLIFASWNPHFDESILPTCLFRNISLWFIRCSYSYMHTCSNNLYDHMKGINTEKHCFKSDIEQFYCVVYCCGIHYSLCVLHLISYSGFGPDSSHEDNDDLLSVRI